jgi:hypothetical protein
MSVLTSIIEADTDEFLYCDIAYVVKSVLIANTTAEALAPDGVEKLVYKELNMIFLFDSVGDVSHISTTLEFDSATLQKMSVLSFVNTEFSSNVIANIEDVTLITTDILQI